MTEDLVAHWGYLGVALGTFLAGESALLVAGAIAGQGLLSLPLVMLTAFTGSFAWSQLWYAVGRAFGAPLVRRRTAWRARAGDVEASLHRHGALFVIGSRFVAGMGLLGPLLLGAGCFPPRRFVLLDALGAVVWTGMLAGAGFGVVVGLSRMLGQSAGWLVTGVALAMLGVASWCARRAVRGR